MIGPGFGCTFRTSIPLLLALLHHAVMSGLQIYAVINVGGLGIREWKAFFRVMQAMASSEGYFTTLTQPKKATSSEVAHPNEIDTAPIWTYLQYSVDLAALTRLCAMALNFFFFLRKINLPFELARSTMTNLETLFPRLLFKTKPVYLACVWVYCPYSAVFLDTVLIHARAYFLTEHAPRV